METSYNGDYKVRQPEYYSPSSLSTWLEDPRKFYLKYLADNRPPRENQTQPMAIGSSFDAYIKCYLSDRLLGVDKYIFEKLFEDQVEPQHRDWALIHGKVLVDKYIAYGCAADLMILLNKSENVKFEVKVEGTIGDIPLLGKPDLWFDDGQGTEIQLDWKVNGYCSKYSVSPRKGYVKVRPSGKQHKDAYIVKGINVLINLEDVEKHWARQLSTYGWLCGATVGEEFVAAVDQLVFDSKGEMRVAEHRCKIGAKFQCTVYEQYQEMHEIIKSGHIFRDKSFDDSIKEQRSLDTVHLAYEGDDDSTRLLRELR